MKVRAEAVSIQQRPDWQAGGGVVRRASSRLAVLLLIGAGLAHLTVRPAGAQDSGARTGQAGGAPAKIQVTERWATRGGAGNELGGVRGMVEDRTGQIWVADARLGALHVFTPAGQYVRTIGRRGDRRGEFHLPGRLVVLEDGRIAVHDEARPSVEVLSANGRSERRVPLGARVTAPGGFAALPDGGWLVSGTIAGSTAELHAFAADGTLRTSWFVSEPERSSARGPMAGPLAVLEEGAVLYAPAPPHAVYHFSAPGSAGQQFTGVAVAQPGAAREAAAAAQPAGPNAPAARALLPVGGGRVLLVVTDDAADESVWHLFGPAGERLAETRLPRAFTPWALTVDGDLLASYRDPETGEPVAARLVARLPDGATLAGEPPAPLYEIEGVTAEARAAQRRSTIPWINDFYRRAELGRGQFIMREEIEQRRPRELWQLLQGLSSLDVVHATGGPMLLNRRTNCAPAVYLDGVVIGGGDAGGQLYGGSVGGGDAKMYVDLLTSGLASSLEGIEFYRGPGETPLEYQGARAQCGVLLLWTRGY